MLINQLTTYEELEMSIRKSAKVEVGKPSPLWWYIIIEIILGCFAIAFIIDGQIIEALLCLVLIGVRAITRELKVKKR